MKLTARFVYSGLTGCSGIVDKSRITSYSWGCQLRSLFGAWCLSQPPTGTMRKELACATVSGRVKGV